MSWAYLYQPLRKMDPHPLSSVSLWICRQWLHLPSHIFPPQWIYTNLLNLLIYATLSKPIIFVTLPGAAFNPLQFWGLVETALIQLPASYLCHVQSWNVEDWLYFLSLIPFACLNTSGFIFLKDSVMCRDRQTHTCMWVQTRTRILYILYIFLFYVLYRLIWIPHLVEAPTLRAGLEDKLGQLWWRAPQVENEKDDNVTLHTGRSPIWWYPGGGLNTEYYWKLCRP